MRGTIEQVWKNESRNGRKYLTVQIGGDKYSVWDAKYFDQLQPGATIEGEVRESGNYKHLSEIEPVRARSDGGYRPSDKDRQITRLSCLKSASEIAAPVAMDIEGKQELVVELARRFERYVYEEDFDFPEPVEGQPDAGKG